MTRPVHTILSYDNTSVICRFGIPIVPETLMMEQQLWPFIIEAAELSAIDDMYR